MSARIGSLRGQDLEHLKSVFESMYLHGNCYILASALHRYLGWNIVVLVRGNYFPHAGVRAPDGRLCDARGFLTTEEFASPFVENYYMYELKIVSEEILWERSYKPIDEVIQRSGAMARIVWPHLPWKEAGLEARVRAFAEELESLCRKHEFWIRSAVPTMPPLIDRGEGDEGGYVLTPTSDGLGYSIDRFLNHEIH